MGRTKGKTQDLTGKVFGRLTVVSRGEVQAEWICKCRCGNTCTKLAYRLTTAHRPTRTCGDCKDYLNYPHEYKAYEAMHSRCYCPTNISYPNYGGRGIEVCQRWKEDFLNFYDDMGNKPDGDYSLDRLDGEKGYSPENCRWSTRVVQNKNRAKFMHKKNRLTPEGDI
jgi:hypothetical protein